MNFDKKTFLYVGEKEINKDLFKPVVDNGLGFRSPNGGLVLMPYSEESGDCKYLNYLVSQKSLLFSKLRRGDDPFSLPCASVSLKGDASIYCLHNKPTYDYLQKCFYENSKEKFEDYYDGIYIDLAKLRDCGCDDEFLSKFKNSDMKFLMLFNIDCISYYKSGDINLSYYYRPEFNKIFGASDDARLECSNPDDFNYCDCSYDISISDTRGRVLKK